MSIFSKYKKQRESSIENSDQPLLLGDDYDTRLNWFQKGFQHCDDITLYEFTVNDTKCGIVFMQNLVDQQLVDDQVLKYIVSPHFASSHGEFMHKLLDLKSISTMNCGITVDSKEALEHVLDGETIIFFQGDSRMLIVPFTSFEKRAVGETENENVIRGPKEAFVEDIHTNISMIRRRIKSSDLKMEQIILGRYTKTKIFVGYIEGLCKEELITEVKKRINNIKMDGVLASSYVEECLDDFPYSPFPQAKKTERPDVAASALLEGRVVILVDGTPIPLIVPVTFYMFLQSPEDYYQRYILTSGIRILRHLFLLVSMLFPSFYIAITTFHPEMIPTTLLITVAAAREIVPFPAIIEAFIMELLFEALREAGIRTPKAVGQAIGILGAIVIGQAAVQAGIVSAPMVIIVSLTGLASFVIPSYDLGFTIRVLRFPVMILAGSFGIFGLLVGCILIFIHMVHLHSFGMPYLSPMAPLEPSDLKDTFYRAPWWAMKRRPSFSGATKTRIHIDRTYPEDDED